MSNHFLNKFQPEPNTGCWIWLGWIASIGYGYHMIEGKWHCAHRLVYEVYKGTIPEGLQLDHLCRNRWCVNPAHLEPVTFQENISRGKRETAAQRFSRITHCKQGHPFDDANTRITSRKGKIWRICRACEKIHWTKSNHKRAAA